MTSKDFIPDSDFEVTPNYPTVFGITLTPSVSGVLIALLGVAAAAYLALNFVLPAWDQYGVLKTEVEKKRSDVQQQEANLKNLDQVKADLATAKQRQQDVLALYANDKTFDTLLLDINQLVTRRNAGLLAATRNKLQSCPSWVRSQFTDLRKSQDFEERIGPLVAKAQLNRFEPDPKSSGIIADGSLGTDLNNKIKREVVSVQIEGNYSHLQSVLRSIERLQPLLLISDFKGSLDSRQSGAQVGGLYQIENGRVRFLTNCQPEPKITASFKLQALQPLSAEEAKAVAPAPSPSPSP